MDGFVDLTAGGPPRRTNSVSCFRILTVARSALTTFACLLVLPLVLAASAGKKSFDIPAADAVSALRQFANQSGRQLIYAGDAVAGVRTTLVKGDFTPREALDCMLQDTGLAVKEDDKTGALAILPGGRASAPQSEIDENAPPPASSSKKKTKRS